MLSQPCLLVLGIFIASIPTAPGFGRREVGKIPLGATAYLVCHGHMLAHEDQEYISLEPVPVLVDARIDPASLETFNGTSDTPEASASGQFQHFLEASSGGPATGQCHLSESQSTAQAMLDFWQGDYGPPTNAKPRLISWRGPAPELPKQRHASHRDAARTKAEPVQLEAR
jgi:hypothetical protein